MLWIDDVITDMKRFCDDHGYTEISSRLDETRKIYHLELQERYTIEFSDILNSETEHRQPSRISETVPEFKRGLRLAHSKD